MKTKVWNIYIFKLTARPKSIMFKTLFFFCTLPEPPFFLLRVWGRVVSLQVWVGLHFWTFYDVCGRGWWGVRPGPNEWKDGQCHQVTSTVNFVNILCRNLECDISNMVLEIHCCDLFGLERGGY
jgi:hypothetical protein